MLLGADRLNVIEGVVADLSCGRIPISGRRRAAAPPGDTIGQASYERRQSSVLSHWPFWLPWNIPADGARGLSTRAI